MARKTRYIHNNPVLISVISNKPYSIATILQQYHEYPTNAIVQLKKRATYIHLYIHPTNPILYKNLFSHPRVVRALSGKEAYYTIKLDSSACTY